MPTFAITVRKINQRRDGKYPIAIRLTHKRVQKYIPTDVYVTNKQIKPDFSGIKDPTILKSLLSDIGKYEDMLVKGLGTDLSEYTAQDLVNYITQQKETAGGTGIDFIAFSNGYIQTLKKNGREGYAASFEPPINHLTDYFERSVVSVKEINVKNLLGFAEFVQKPRTMHRPNQLGKVTESKKPGVKPQTVKDYFTRLQILFKAACDEYNDEDAEIQIITHNPFGSKKLQIEVKEAPAKRDLSVEALVKILKAETLPGQRMQLARDVCALSFYLLAINTADIFGEDITLTGRRIMYHRQKTATRRKDEALMRVKIEPEALPLIRKYRDPDKKRFFNFYKMYGNYKYFNKAVNKGCEQLAIHLGIDPNLTSYFMRHSWATIAAEDCGISDGDIALALNHVGDADSLEKSKSLKVTRGYINRRFTRNDVNHRMVLDFVKSKF